MMMRRTLIAAAASGLFAASHVTEAQQAGKAPRIGYLAFNTAEIARDQIAAFRQALRERGWTESDNVRIHYRFAERHVARLPALVAELVDLKVDVIVAASSASTLAAKNATKAIPIVMATSADAVGEGFVTSLARPGGNITGMTFLAGPEIAGKQLQLLMEMAPSASRVALLVNPTNRSHVAFVAEVTSAASRLGTRIQVFEARTPDQLDRVFSAITTARAAALLVLTDAMFFGQRRTITDRAAKSGLVAMYSQREFVALGGLASYGPSLADMFRRSATHVDKILRGARPMDLPVEQTRFELVVNLKAAKALGLTIPQSVRLFANELLE